MAKILFICSGNIGRSQIAEAYYNHLTNSHDAFSAGTNESVPKMFQRLPDEIIDVMKEKGIDIRNQKVKLVTREMVDKSDKIFVMCKKEECPDFLLNSKKLVFWSIEDPYRKGPDFLKKTRDIIKSKIISII